MGIVAQSIGPHRFFADCASADAARSTIPFASANSMAWQRLPSDPMGDCTIRLSNAVVGSRYRIELSGDGTTVASGVIAPSTTDIVIQYYQAGSDYNNLRIKVRNASGSPSYRPFETQAVAAAGTVLVWIQQELDE